MQAREAVSEGLIEHELGIICVYGGRTWEQGKTWVPSHRGARSGYAQVMSRVPGGAGGGQVLSSHRTFGMLMARRRHLATTSEPQLTGIFHN